MRQASCDSITENLVKQFSVVFDGNIHTIEGEKFHICLVDDAVPFHVKTPRTIPFAYRDKLKAVLDKLLE